MQQRLLFFTMRKIFPICSIVIAFLALGCTGNNDGKCHIYGTISQKYDGKKIFLKPFQGKATMETVDSVVIKDGKFEFLSDSTQMKVILLDYHYRDGVENLLVVTEPGDLNVEIGETSRSWGTPQNDSLQQWKEKKQVFDKQVPVMRAEAERLKGAGYKEKADSMLAKAKAMRVEFNNYSRRLASNMKEGVLHDFLTPLFPLTYKRVMPDSTEVEYYFDTHEPVVKQ